MFAEQSVDNGGGLTTTSRCPCKGKPLQGGRVNADKASGQLDRTQDTDTWVWTNTRDRTLDTDTWVWTGHRTHGTDTWARQDIEHRAHGPGLEKYHCILSSNTNCDFI